MADLTTRDLLELLARQPRDPADELAGINAPPQPGRYSQRGSWLPDLSGVPAFGQRGAGAVAREFGPGVAQDAAMLAMGPAGRFMTAAPKATAAVLGALTAGSPSEAANDAPAKDYQAPGLLKELMSIFSSSKADDDRPLTRDQYRQERSTIKPKSESDYIKGEQDALKATEEYKKSQNQSWRKNKDSEAEARGRKLYAAEQKSADDEQRRIDSSYGDYVEGWKKQRLEHLSKPFVERNPIAGSVLTYGGPLASAAATRYGFGAIDKYGSKIADKGLAAKAADDVRGLADSILSAKRFQWWAPASKAAIFGEAAALPVELRMAADFGDANALPPDAPASQAAQKRLGNMSEYITKGEQNLMSGGVGALSGALWNKMPQASLFGFPVGGSPSPAIDLATVRAQGRGIPMWQGQGGWQPPTRRAPDQIAIDLATRALAAKEAQAALRAAPQPTPGSPVPAAGQTTGPAPLVGEVQAPGVAVAPPETRGRLVDQLLEPRQGQQLPAGPSSSQQLIETLRRGPANSNKPKTIRVKESDGIVKHRDPETQQYTKSPDNDK
jgi:hypothetical protein